MGHAHGIKWTDELTEKEIRKVVFALGIDRMPTRSEIQCVSGNCCLTNRISKTYGFYGWAKILNLSIKESETTTGKEYERFASEYLRKHGYAVRRMSQNYSFDLLLNNCIKIDVKTSRIYNAKDGSHWHTFNLEKDRHACDIYMFITLVGDDEVDKILIIPSSLLKISQLSIGLNSRYDKYNKRIDYIEKYLKFYNSII